MFGHMGGFNGYNGNGFYSNGFGGYGSGFGYGMMGGGFSQLIFLILIGVVIYLFVKRSSSSSSSKSLFNSYNQSNYSHSNSEAREIAKLRYARGEISLEEYQQIINSLN